MELTDLGFDAMKISSIRNEADYDRALGEIARYFADEPVAGTPADGWFDFLAKLIEAYETEHWPISLS